MAGPGDTALRASHGAVGRGRSFRVGNVAPRAWVAQDPARGLALVGGWPAGTVLAVARSVDPTLRWDPDRHGVLLPLDLADAVRAALLDALVDVR